MNERHLRPPSLPASCDKRWHSSTRDSGFSPPLPNPERLACNDPVLPIEPAQLDHPLHTLGHARASGLMRLSRNITLAAQLRTFTPGLQYPPAFAGLLRTVIAPHRSSHR